MSATTSLILTPTGHSITQPGLAHAMQRDASVSASAGGRPRFTASKVRLRTCGSSSGMMVRTIFIRSLSGRGLRSVAGCVLASDIVLLLGIQLCLKFAFFLLPGGQLRAKLRHLLFLLHLELLERLALFFAVHRVALHQHFKVHQRSIELRSVTTGELALAAKQNAAPAAHAGAIHHDRIETDQCLDSERTGNAGNGTHHGHGANGEHKVDMPASIEKTVELVRYEPLLAVSAVIGHNVGFVAGLADFIFEDHQLFAARPFDKNDVVAGL